MLQTKNKTKNSIILHQTKKEVGIYVHIPFCNAKCLYCNFNSYVINPNQKNELHNKYLQAVLQEIDSYKTQLSNHIVTTIFIGGGTPSVLIEGGITKILNQIRHTFVVSGGCEITMEINPNAFSAAQAQEWFDAGVNRVSVGLQSTNNQILKKIGRTHTLEQFLQTIKTLKQVGFSNINADLMLGLPTQTTKDVKHAVRTLLKLKIPHISAYSLILEDETPLANLLQNGFVTLPSEEETVKMYDIVYKTLKRNGLKRYEVSNFAKNGYACRHNLNCWHMIEYVGFGAGAHSFFANTRHKNALGIEAYIGAMQTQNHAAIETETIDKQELLEETLLLGMRLATGVNLLELQKTFKRDLLQEKQQVINEFVALKLMKHKNNHLFATKRGFYVLNQLILDLVYEEQ